MPWDFESSGRALEGDGYVTGNASGMPPLAQLLRDLQVVLLPLFINSFAVKLLFSFAPLAPFAVKLYRFVKSGHSARREELLHAPARERRIGEQPRGVGEAE